MAILVDFRLDRKGKAHDVKEEFAVARDVLDQLGAGETVSFEEILLQLGVCLGRISLSDFDDFGPVMGAEVREVVFEYFGDLGAPGVSLAIWLSGKIPYGSDRCSDAAHG